MELGSFSAHPLTTTLQRLAVALLMASCVAFAASCSSDSSNGEATPEDTDPQSLGEQANAVDQSAGDQESLNGDAEVNADLNEQRVCELIEPVVDEMVAATSLDVELDGDISEPLMSAVGCDLRLNGPDGSFTVTIGRVPDLFGSVDAFTGTFSDAELVGPAPSLGSDAQLIRNTLAPSVFTVMWSNGRVWQVTASDNLASSTGNPTTDVETVAVSVAEVLKGRLEG